MSLIAENRQGQAREKEHSKHSRRKRHSGVTEAAALVIGCPDMKALLVALPFLESHFSVLPYKDTCAPDTRAFLLFLEHAKLTSTTGLLHLPCSEKLAMTDGFHLSSEVGCSERSCLTTCSKEATSSASSRFHRMDLIQST